jgi:hypothetical protein
VAVCAQTDRSEIGQMLEQGPVADRVVQAPVVELARVAARMQVVVRQAGQEGVAAVEDERRVARDPGQR